MVSNRTLAIFSILTSGSVALVVAEVVLRVLLFSDVIEASNLRQAWRFADPSIEDDYWKLSALFAGVSRRVDEPRFVPHERLGWAPRINRDNPLGIIRERAYSKDEIVNQRPVLFFGDSFVEGVTGYSSSIPSYLEDMSGRVVLNYGVSGYGLDQSFLRLADSVAEFSAPTMFVGVLMDDLNRPALAFRQAPKPKFVVASKGVVLQAPATFESLQHYLEQNPVEISSYLYRFVVFRLRPYMSDETARLAIGKTGAENELARVNRYVLGRIRDVALSADGSLQFVLFYAPQDLRTLSDNERFVKQELDELGLSYLDTKPLLLNHVAQTGTGLESVYTDDEGHLNAEGNKLVAAELADWLRRDRAVDH